MAIGRLIIRMIQFHQEYSRMIDRLGVTVGDCETEMK